MHLTVDQLLLFADISQNIALLYTRCLASLCEGEIQCI